jgi:hypothetical protein
MVRVRIVLQDTDFARRTFIIARGGVDWVLPETHTQISRPPLKQ